MLYDYEIKKRLGYYYTHVDSENGRYGLNWKLGVWHSLVWFTSKTGMPHDVCSVNTVSYVRYHTRINFLAFDEIHMLYLRK